MNARYDVVILGCGEAGIFVAASLSVENTWVVAPCRTLMEST